MNGTKIKLKSRGRGFTILELLIAMMVFSVIMLVIAIGVLRFTYEYYKGITSSKTQTMARSIMSDLTQAIQFSSVVGTAGPDASGVGGVCVDNKLFYYKLGQQVEPVSPDSSKHQGYHGLVVVPSFTCSAAPTMPLTPTGFPNGSSLSALPAGSSESLGAHMRLSALTVSGSGGIYTIHVRVVYGDDDLLFSPSNGGPTANDVLCQGSSGSQFCAVSDLTTTVQQRL